MENKIVLTNVTYKTDKLEILKDITFTITDGTFLNIIGPNGAGKTTLIKLILGHIKPTSGLITITNNDIGYLPQKLETKKNFPITVKELIYSGFKKQKLIISKNDLVLINSWLDKLSITYLLNSSVTNLSGGELQKVLLIRALISNPKIIILDEPTSALDSSFRDVFYSIIKDLSKNNKHIIINITHNLEYDDKNELVLLIDKEIDFFGTKNEFKKKMVSTHV